MHKDELKPTEEIQQRAKELRSKPTPTEKKLWAYLSNRQLREFKFRRQHPIGRFIADFYCHSAKLIIELDGEIHAAQVEYDNSRTLWFEDRGIRVIRFLNIEVETDVKKVIAEIIAVCKKRA